MKHWLTSLRRSFMALRNDDRGAALIIAMLIVSIMSVATMETLQTMRFAARMSVNIEEREQTKLYALGSEAFVTSLLQQLMEQEGGSQRLRAMLGETIRFPIDGGLIELNASDGGNCFNVNALVMSEEGKGMVANPAKVAQLVTVMEGIGVPTLDANDVVNAVVDWIDSDKRPGFGGAEDDYYMARDTPYRTADQFIVDRTELRSVLGVNKELLEALGRLICVRPDQTSTKLNLNTLTFEDAPLLQAYLGEEFDLQTAQSLIAERPIEGYADAEAFFSLGTFASRPVTDEIKQTFVLETEFIELDARIWRNEAALSGHFTLQISETGEINTLSRKFGVF